MTKRFCDGCGKELPAVKENDRGEFFVKFSGASVAVRTRKTSGQAADVCLYCLGSAIVSLAAAEDPNVTKADD